MTDADGSPTFIDTHAHLDDGQFERDLDAVLTSARAVGVRHVINIGYRPERWETTIALAARSAMVSFTLGVHPHHADEWSDETGRRLQAVATEHTPVAIGEIGLDYFRDFSDREAQRRALAAQLELASRLGLPVVFHLRGDVESDLLAILRDAPPVPAVFHSFDGSADLADFALERGDFFGVGGLATRPSSTRLREIVARLPLDRIVLETDSPYLAPASVRDRRNSPVNIPVIARSLAELKSAPIEQVAAATTANAVRFFGLPAVLLEATPEAVG